MTRFNFKPRTIAPIHLLVCAVMLATVACATRHEVVDEYKELLLRDPHPTGSRTTLFLLIDGLSIETLSSELKLGHLYNLHQYFIADKNKFFKARTTFPSLTFPAIASLLTEQTVDLNGIYGNEITRDGKSLDFENVADYPALNGLIEKHNIFARLGAKGQRTASFDYAFQSGSTVHTSRLDFEAALALRQGDYAYVDSKTIESVRLLLNETPATLWPDFIFIHLLGVDLTSHDLGPRAEKSRQYLDRLDSKLGVLFKVLKQAEVDKKRRVVAMLSSDHGFAEQVKRTVKLEESLTEQAPGVRAVDEGRLLGLYFPPSWNDTKRAALVKNIAQSPDVDLVALQSGNRIYLEQSQVKVSVVYKPSSACGPSGYEIAVSLLLNPNAKSWSCPDHLDQTTADLFYPYFIENVSHYFRAPGRPDALILVRSLVAFNDKYLGQHGGPTTPEVLVPLLLHNAELPNPKRIPALSELLGFL